MSTSHPDGRDDTQTGSAQSTIAVVDALSHAVGLPLQPPTCKP